MNEDITLSSKIEALLFYKGEPLAVSNLERILGADAESVEHALGDLEDALRGRGVQLVRNGGEVLLGTAAKASPLIEALQREEVSKDIGKAGLETLAIVLYKGPISRREIDYIRGVNSQFILRNLLVRGLIERLEEKGKERYLYKPTTNLLSFMGLGRREDLPEFEAMKEQMENFTATEDDKTDES